LLAEYLSKYWAKITTSGHKPKILHDLDLWIYHMHQNSGWFWAFFGGTGKGPRASSGCPDPTHRGSSFPHVPEGIHFEMESISQKRDYNFFSRPSFRDVGMVSGTGFLHFPWEGKSGIALCRLNFR
jgi:hypothetical protein